MINLAVREVQARTTAASLVIKVANMREYIHAYELVEKRDNPRSEDVQGTSCPT